MPLTPSSNPYDNHHSTADEMVARYDTYVEKKRVYYIDDPSMPGR